MSNLTVNKFGVDIPLKSLAEVRFNSPSVSVINEQDLLVFLVKLVSDTYFKCGVKADAQELKAISNAFKNELKMFGYITVTELQKCFNEGYKERYGKYYGLNVKTFVQWLDYYIQNVRNDDLNKAKKPKKVKQELSEDEKKAFVKSGMIKCFEHWAQNESILDGYSNFLYDVLFDDGYLPKDKETKEKFLNDAKTVLEFEAHNTKPNSREEHLKYKELLNDIAKPKGTKTINKAKEMIVCKFMREAHKNKELLNEIKSKYEIK